MILPGAPRLSQTVWTVEQKLELNAFWQEIARVVNNNAAATGVATIQPLAVPLDMPQPDDITSEKNSSE